MQKIREVLRLRLQGFSGRRASHRLGPDYLVRADAAGVDWAAAECLGDRELERLLVPRDGEKRRSAFPVPDWKEVYRELRRKSVTLSLPLEEYQTGCGCQGYSYSRFCDLYREWEGRAEPVMRQRQAAGERLEVDYAGPHATSKCNSRKGQRSHQTPILRVPFPPGLTEDRRGSSLPRWTGGHSLGGSRAIG